MRKARRLVDRLRTSVTKFLRAAADLHSQTARRAAQAIVVATFRARQAIPDAAHQPDISREPNDEVGLRLDQKEILVNADSRARERSARYAIHRARVEAPKR